MKLVRENELMETAWKGSNNLFLVLVQDRVIYEVNGKHYYYYCLTFDNLKCAYGLLSDGGKKRYDKDFTLMVYEDGAIVMGRKKDVLEFKKSFAEFCKR